MHQTPRPGHNRTGIGAAPERASEMQGGTEAFPPAPGTNGHNVARVRASYAEEGFRVGSIPNTGEGGRALPEEVLPLIDKLGARMAFERTGTRLYDGLISKHEAYGSFDGGPSRDDLRLIRDQELEHFELVSRCISELGGDVSAVTPSANLQLTAGKGIGAVIADPRTTLLESLEAILVAELTDRASWEALTELARQSGQDGFASEFERARATEEEHLEKVEAWIAAGQGRRPTRH